MANRYHCFLTAGIRPTVQHPAETFLPGVSRTYRIHSPGACMAYPKIPAQKQDRQPGLEREMHPQAEFIRDSYKGSGKLAGKVALVSGGDSGIGRAAVLHFAREGADVAIMYLDEHDDAEDAKRLVEAEGR